MTTILVVDDEYPIAKLFADVFDAEGYDVLLAGDGLEALAQLEAQRVDLILTDIMMPNMTGLELCAAVTQHATYGSIPLVLLSAVAYEVDMRTCRYAAKLAKPVDIDRLLATVSQVLQRATQDAEARPLR